MATLPLLLDRLRARLKETEHKPAGPGGGQFTGHGGSSGSSTSDGGKPPSGDHEAHLDEAARSKVKRILSAAVALPAKLVPPRVKQAVQKVKGAVVGFLTRRYGARAAGLILKAAALSAPIPVPGSQPITIAVSLVVAEALRTWWKLTGKGGEQSLTLDEIHEAAQGLLKQIADAIKHELGVKSLDVLLARLRIRLKGDFVESEHPRDDIGEFTAGGGGGSSAGGKEGEGGNKAPLDAYEQAQQQWQEETGKIEAAHEEAVAAWKAEVQRIEDKYTQTHDAWQARQDAREERGNALDNADPVGDANSPERTPAVAALEKAAAAWKEAAAARYNEGGREKYSQAAHDFGAAQVAAWQAAYGTGSDFHQQLKTLGATDKDLTRVDAIVARESKDLQKGADKLDKLTAAHVAFLGKLNDLESKEPVEPEEPDEPQEADYEEGDAQFDQDHAAWETAIDAYEGEKADYDTYQEKLDSAREKEDELASAVDDWQQELETTGWEEATQPLTDFVDKIKERETNRLGKEEERDEEPPESPDDDELPEEPEEPDYPDEPDASDFVDEDEDEPEEEDKTALPQLLKRLQARLKDTAHADDDPDEAAALMADVLYGVYGRNALRLLDQSKKTWREDFHPRGADGKFIPKGSSEAGKAAHEAVRSALHGSPSPRGAEHLLGHLAILSVKQLRELHGRHGGKAPPRLRAQLVAAISQRLQHNEPSPGKPEEPAEGQGFSPEFKKWFDGSKVVDQKGDPKEVSHLDAIPDAQGKPIVVYHGGRDFEHFDKSKIAHNGHWGAGFYFTENGKEAEEYLAQVSRAGEKGKIHEVYLSIRKPFDTRKDGVPLSSLPPAVVRRMTGGPPTPEELAYRASYDELRQVMKTDDINAHLQKLGYDGLATKGAKGNWWVAFEPEQIKHTHEAKAAAKAALPSLLKRLQDRLGE